MFVLHVLPLVILFSPMTGRFLLHENIFSLHFYHMVVAGFFLTLASFVQILEFEACVLLQSGAHLGTTSNGDKPPDAFR